MSRRERYLPDLDAYHERARTGPCFVCGIVARDPDFPDRHIVYEGDSAIAFFNRCPTQRGYVLVAPKEHREQATGDFTADEYLALQRVVYGVAEAVREEVGAERVYVLSLGSTRATPTSTSTSCPGPPARPTRSSSSPPLCWGRRARWICRKTRRPPSPRASVAGWERSDGFGQRDPGPQRRLRLPHKVLRWCIPCERGPRRDRIRPRPALDAGR